MWLAHITGAARESCLQKHCSVTWHEKDNEDEWSLEIFVKNKTQNYEAWPECKDTKVFNMYNIFNLQKRHCEWIACT